MCLSVSVTRNGVSQVHAERNVTLELAEEFALMWHCLPECIKDAGDSHG